MSKKSAKRRVFIVYSKHDEEWMTRVRRFIDSLRGSGELEAWSDTCLEPGRNWRRQLRKNLESADAALLLLSSDFLGTDFIGDEGAPVRGFADSSPHFIGRGRELVQVARGMHDRPVTLVSGISGVGKRLLAIEAAYRNVWRFSDGLAECAVGESEQEAGDLTATTVLNRLAELFDVDRRMGAGTAAADRGIQLQRLLSLSPCLCVLSGMGEFARAKPREFEKLVQFFVQNSGKSHCIITTQGNLPTETQLSRTDYNHISLNPLNTEESRRLIQLLAREREDTEYLATMDDAVKRLAELSGGYAQVLMMAVRLTGRQPIDTVIEQLRRHQGKFAEKLDFIVETMLRHLDDEVRQVFHCFGSFPAHSISTHTVAVIGNALGISRQQATDAIEALVTASLIRYDHKTERYYWDRTVHEYAARDGLDEPLQRRLDEELLTRYSCADEAFGTALTQGESAVNILAVLGRMQSSDWVVDREPLDVGLKLALHAQKRGLEFEGQPLLQSVVGISRLSTGNSDQIDSSKVASLLYDIASVQQAQGDYRAAEENYRASLHFNEKNNDDRYGIARSYHGLGRLAHDRGNFEEARSWYEKSLLLRKQGSKQGDIREHPHTIAQIQHELARLAHDEGRLRLAGQLHEQTLKLRETPREDGRPDLRGIAATKYEMGRLAQDQADWNRAEALYAESERYWVNGDYPIGIAMVQHARASLLMLRGDSATAHRLFSQCRLTQEHAGDRRGVAATVTQLGMLAILEERLGDAREHLQESLAMQCSGQNRGGELTARIGLALVDQGEGRVAQAEQALNEIRADCEKAKETKLLAKTKLLLGWLKAAKLQQPNTADGDPDDNREVAVDYLFSALEFALRNGDRCVEAAAKKKIGMLLESSCHAGAKFSRDAEELIETLHGQRPDDVNVTCNIMASLC